ncbi:Plant Tudor-like protein [Perilla frutescens var. hirtella]|nr:Plant Tudor-like protein [Perilla frutescens var. hirtella]
MQASASDSESADNPFAPPDPPPRTNDRRWEAGFHVEILEFTSNLTADDFMDWLASVEETLDFKIVPALQRVHLVATRLR